ncbi:MAG: hypothetical protein HZB70_01990 [Candidatus Berkelbacteria bacterium]|nr:MAG: hypothetical protein HZB70_01990 [Candidatus Berkelbacteria bacterium]QQG51906.1 MAG: hypothetical protein HY845_01005 [Candidatus Berkelbacteria bacterium]
MNNSEEVVLLRDNEWSVIDSKLCIANELRPLGSTVENGEVISKVKDVPYATISLRCKGIDREISGFITNKMDFQHFWEAFQEKSEGLEVLFYWTKTHYQNRLIQFGTAVMPKVVVILCPKGTFESVTEDFSLRPKEDARANVYGLTPTKFWIPPVILGGKIES